MNDEGGVKEVPIWFARPDTWPEVQESIGGVARAFAAASGFEPKPGRLQLLPDAAGALAGVLFGDSDASTGFEPLAAGKLARHLPAGAYRFANMPKRPDLACLGFLLADYRFDAFKADPTARPSLSFPEGVNGQALERTAAAVAWGRGLVNAPANVLGPEALEKEAFALAALFAAEAACVRGDELLAQNFPLIHAVGAAAAEAPRLVDITWGRVDAPKVTLVGKGVAFDTGGLDIKPANGMELMKKDMGGAATAMVLARLIMSADLDVRLRVLLPIVENSIASRAMRPGDIYRSRKGLSVEIGNTDAEGRLILADALALAAEESPDLLLDFATLTGAARVALGPDLPPFYTDDDALAAEIAEAAVEVCDPLWRMPLWAPYGSLLDSPYADMNNSPGSPFAGSVTAALFLKPFVEGAKSWTHFDVYAWNPKPRAHAPQGGEIQASRAVFRMLERKYARQR